MQTRIASEIEKAPTFEKMQPFMMLIGTEPISIGRIGPADRIFQVGPQNIFLEKMKGFWRRSNGVPDPIEAWCNAEKTRGST